jgi:uncharacterized SAM-binding protein YcdF (DUF218 family)
MMTFVSLRYRRWLRAAGLPVVALWGALSAVLFVWPSLDPIKGARADAILVMGGPGPRLQVALELAKEHAAPVMLVSVASVRWNCPSLDVPGVRVECFRPDPFTTQGEARYVAGQARVHGWHSLIVVSSVPQSTRARLRVERCFHGTVKVVGARPSLASWTYGVIYEWGALVKALVWQRSC